MLDVDEIDPCVTSWRQTQPVGPPTSRLVNYLRTTLHTCGLTHLGTTSQLRQPAACSYSNIPLHYWPIIRAVAPALRKLNCCSPSAAFCYSHFLPPAPSATNICNDTNCPGPKPCSAAAVATVGAPRRHRPQLARNVCRRVTTATSAPFRHRSAHTSHGPLARNSS